MFPVFCGISGSCRTMLISLKGIGHLLILSKSYLLYRFIVAFAIIFTKRG